MRGLGVEESTPPLALDVTDKPLPDMDLDQPRPFGRLVVWLGLVAGNLNLAGRVGLGRLSHLSPPSGGWLARRLFRQRRTADGEHDRRSRIAQFENCLALTC